MKKFLVAIFAISFAFTTAACGPEEESDNNNTPTAECTVETQDNDCDDGNICNADGKCEAQKIEEGVESGGSNLCKEGVTNKDGVKVCNDTPKGAMACTAENADEVCDSDESCIEDICVSNEETDADTRPCDPFSTEEQCGPGGSCTESGVCANVGPPPTPCTEETVENDCHEDEICADDVCTMPPPPVCSPEALDGTCEDGKVCSETGECVVPPVCSPEALNGVCEAGMVCSAEGECIEPQCQMDADCAFDKLCLAGLCTAAD